MKACNKIIINQFKAKIRKLLKQYYDLPVKFYQFLQILTANYIRFYSKNDIMKIRYFFDNNNKQCLLRVPLSYLQLQCSQQSENRKYFIVKVSNEQINLDVFTTNEEKHNVFQCLNVFTKIMKKQYGSQRNWFKALSGLTVAVTIQPSTFSKSLTKILQNTLHRTCASNLTNLFLQESKTNKIQWKLFMKTIQNSDSDFPRIDVVQQSENWTVKPLFPSYQLTKIIFGEDQDQDQQNQNKIKNKRMSLKSKESRAKTTQKRFNRTSMSVSENSWSKKKVQFPTTLSLSADKCKIYKKDFQQNINLHRLALSSRKSRLYKSSQRRIKTQSEFFPKEEQRMQRKDQKGLTQSKQIINSTFLINQFEV